MGNLSVGECATKVYEAAREGSSELTDLLKRLETTVQTKTALETKTKNGLETKISSVFFLIKGIGMNFILTCQISFKNQPRSHVNSLGDIS